MSKFDHAIDHILSRLGSPPNRTPSPPGFRFSRMDAAAIVVTLVLTLALHPILGELAFLFPLVLAHFFLFCNVFRVHRNAELIWAGAFILNTVLWTLLSHFSLKNILLSQTPVTLIILVYTLTRPSYHGIFCTQKATS